MSRSNNSSPPVDRGADHTVTITADYAGHVDAPLVKDKIGVYQTPFMGTAGLAPLTAMEPFLTEAGVRDLRYETAWGKPDAFAFSQIAGTANSLTVDFSQLDPFMTMLHRVGVQPLLAVGYNPTPLQTCSGTKSNCWQSAPASYPGWQEVLRQVSAHYATVLGIGGVQYEMWNEPDLSSGAYKTFFDGGPADYGSVYKYGVAGVQAGAGNSSGVTDALVGGPAIAYDSTYISQSGLLQQPVDFFSIHAYANYASQIASLRSAVVSHNPLYLTEYGSYVVNGLSQPNGTHAGAMQFFADINSMLNDSDVPKIYWAQWIDDSLGMITYSLKRKAIFNAYKIYQTMLPVDRVPVTISNASAGLGSMAAGDAHTAGIVVWNTTAVAQPVSVELANLQFPTGVMTQWFVDQNHASVEDNASESLTSDGDSKSVVNGNSATWTGTIQPQSLVYLHATDGLPSLLVPNKLGTYAGDHFYFSGHPTQSYADFDPLTSTARLGMGTSATGTAVVGNAYDVDATTKGISVSLSKSGTFTPGTANSTFGVLVDYQNRNGVYDKSVLYTDGSLYNDQRTLILPWGRSKAVPDAVKTFTGSSFAMDFAADAPPDWNGNRIIISPLLIDAGAGAGVRLQFRVVR